VKNILFNSHIQHTSRHGKWIYILEKSWIGGGGGNLISTHFG
jgi:hypothetical protein